MNSAMAHTYFHSINLWALACGLFSAYGLNENKIFGDCQINETNVYKTVAHVIHLIPKQLPVFVSRLDGVTPEGSPGDQPSGVDRPLTQPGSGGSPAAGAFTGTPGRHSDGAGTPAAGVGSSGKPAACDWSAGGGSYAEVLRRQGGPQAVEPSSLMDTLLSSPGGCPNNDPGFGCLT